MNRKIRNCILELLELIDESGLKQNDKERIRRKVEFIYEEIKIDP